MEQIKARIAAMNLKYVEMDFRNLFLDSDWVDFSASDGASITPNGIKAVERRAQKGSIT